MILDKRAINLQTPKNQPSVQNEWIDESKTHLI